MTATQISGIVSPLNGVSFVSSSYKMSPSDQMSARESTVRDEVLSRLHEVLFFGDAGGAAPLVTSYAGRGSLRSWTRSVAIHQALKMRRKDIPLDSLIPQGWDEAQKLIGRYIEAGLTKFVVRASGPDGGSAPEDFLSGFIRELLPLQT